MKNQSKDFLSVITLIYSSLIFYVFLIAKLNINYFMELLFFSLFFDLFILSEQLFVVFFRIVIIFRLNSLLFAFFFFTIFLYKLLWIFVFRERISSQIKNQILILIFWSFNFFLDCSLVLVNKIHIIIINGLFIISFYIGFNFFMLVDFNASVFHQFYLRLSF